MDSREKIMASNYSRPDERKREEARLARANQLKPLAEPETPQITQGDNSFSRVDVHHSESDHMAKTVQEVLGPFSSCLRMDGFYPPKFREVERIKTPAEDDSICDPAGGRNVHKQSVLDTGQQSSSSVGSSGRNGTKILTNPSAPAENKRPSSLPVSHQKQSSNVLASAPTSKPSKPPVVSTPPEVLSTPQLLNQTALPTVSSPVVPVLSPQSSKDIPPCIKNKDGPKDSGHLVKEHTPPPQSLSSKLKTGLTSVLAKSPVKEALFASSHSSHTNSQSVKSSRPIESADMSGSQASEMANDHQPSHQSSLTPKQPFSALTSSSTSSSSAQQHSTSPVLPASSHTSPLSQVKASSSPLQRPKSTTPPKSIVRGLNGLTTPHSKLSSSLPDSKFAALARQSAEKNRYLKLQIPHEINSTLSKSDLNDIFKEMIEVQPLHSAIETPQKVAERLTFPVTLASIPERLSSKDNSKARTAEEPQDRKPDKTKGQDETTGCGQEEHQATKVANDQTSVEGKQEEVTAPAALPQPAPSSVDEVDIVKHEQPALPLGALDRDGAGDSSKYNVRVKKKTTKSIGKTIPVIDNSILMRDLDLSEDSDADSVSDDNTSASQSKKGKVISTSSEIPVKRAQSVESSSSSSSSSSGSDSDSDSALEDDDEDDHQVGKEKTLEQRLSERRSSSSSSSSSDSSSGSDSEDGDDDEEEDKTETVEEMRTAAEKTPSPLYNKPASVGTPHSVDNHDNKSWSLINFINPPRKSSTSPVAASPSKPFSPPTVHSAPPSVQLKEDSCSKPSDETRHQRTLKEIGPCVSMPFDVLAASKHSDEEADIDEVSEVLNVKTSHQPAVRKSSSSSVKESKKKIDQGGDNRKQWSKDNANLDSPPIRKHEYSSTPKSSGPEKKLGTPSFSSLEKSSSSKRLSKTGSSSDDEIVDVVGFTPEKTQQPPNKISNKGKQVVAISNGTLLSASDEDNHDSMITDKNAPNNQPKHHRRKDPGRTDSNTSANISTELLGISEAPAVVKTSKMLPSDLESISRPPNLLSPIHSAYSPSPTPSSSKPLPSFRTSFSPTSSPAKPPTVTVSRDRDGAPAPRVMIQIRQSFLSEKQVARLREKKEKLKSGAKLSKDVNPIETSLKSESVSDSQKDCRVPPVPDIKSNSVYSSSIKETSAQRSSQNEITSTQTGAKASKRKPLGSDTIGVSDGPDDHNHKVKKSHKEMSQAPTSTSSVSSNNSTVNVPSSKSSKSSILNTDSVLSANKAGHSNAVKNLDFESNSEVIPVNDTSSETNKNSKRKLDNGDELLSKRVKAELKSSEKSPSVTLIQQPASISRSRRDSTASNSSKGSHQSIKKSNRRSSSNSNKNTNNNNIEKSNTHIINGPDLPFHQYVNGTSRVAPSNLPSPLPIETQLQSTEHYLARAKEHKHLADSQKDKLAKFEPYLRSCLNFFLAGYTIEQGKKDLNASYTLYNDTSNLLQYVIRMRANSSTNPDSSDREKKLIVLIIRLRSFLNHRLYRQRKPEVSKLKKVIDSEQSKLPSSTPASTAATTNSSSSSNKAHAPSPHQSNWNKNSTGTPSPMSPTPSPATSVSSQGSCELVQGKLANGSSQISPSPGMVTVQQRVHTVTQRYFVLTSHMVKALELWDQADAESRGLEDFFALVDSACGVLPFHSEPPVIVRYMKHALRLLSL